MYPEKFILNNSIPTNGYYNSVSVSYNGKYQTTVQRNQSDTSCKNGNLYISKNYGKNWRQIFLDSNEVSLNLNWTCVSVSGNGKYQSAVVQGGNIYNSNDYGITWIKNINAPINQWYGISVSYSGQYQTAMPNGFKNSDTPYGFIYTSNDYGNTWKSHEEFGNNLWLNCSISKTGQKQVAITFGDEVDGVFTENITGSIYISNDFGNSWNVVPNISNYFNGCVMSYCGNYITVCSSNCNYAPAIPQPLYTSSDGGLNWSVLNSQSTTWLNVAMSGNGKYQSAISYKQDDTIEQKNTGYLYQSFDYGKTWKLNKNVQQNTWTSTSISGNGKIQTLVGTICQGVYNGVNKKNICYYKN
jgi:hypothetical protein